MTPRQPKAKAKPRPRTWTRWALIHVDGRLWIPADENDEALPKSDVLDYGMEDDTLIEVVVRELLPPHKRKK